VQIRVSPASYISTITVTEGGGYRGLTMDQSKILVPLTDMDQSKILVPLTDMDQSKILVPLTDMDQSKILVPLTDIFLLTTKVNVEKKTCNVRIT